MKKFASAAGQSGWNMSGKKSRDKGARFERYVVAKLKTMGYEAKRVPLSGAADGFPGDVMVKFPCAVHGHKWLTVECKIGRQVPNFIYEKLETHKALIVKRDRKPPLVVLRLEDWTP